MNYTISFDNNPNHKDTTTLWNGISENAKALKGYEPGKAFAFFIKDELSDIKGGCSGFIFYGCLYIDLLWVDETLRGQGYGTQLMERAEKLAFENHCRIVTVNTMDFEAPEFYKKLGYFVEYKRDSFEKGSVMYFFRKNLDNIS